MAGSCLKHWRPTSWQRRPTRVWLTSSDMALGFYEHMGWVNPNGYRVRAGEENLLYMEKRK